MSLVAAAAPISPLAASELQLCGVNLTEAFPLNKPLCRPAAAFSLSPLFAAIFLFFSFLFSMKNFAASAPEDTFPLV